jgi:hypothetical protein
MATLPDAHSVLSAMITPAVLISASASLIMATSARLIRAVDRTRETSTRFAELAESGGATPALIEERSVLFALLDFNTTRCRLLQRALAHLYRGLGAFIGTSVAIGVVAATGRAYTWLPIIIGLGGAGLLLYASALLVRESRIALVALEREMDFVWAQGKAHAPAELLAARDRAHVGLFGRRRG